MCILSYLVLVSYLVDRVECIGKPKILFRNIKFKKNENKKDFIEGEYEDIDTKDKDD